MAETAVFAGSGAVLFKIGENYDTTAWTGPSGEIFRNFAAGQAEALINTLTRNNWSDVYATLNDDVKKLLEEAAACWTAVDFITYNMAGYTSRNEAEDMINILWAKFNYIIDVLKDQKAVTYVAGG